MISFITNVFGKVESHLPWQQARGSFLKVILQEPGYHLQEQHSFKMEQMKHKADADSQQQQIRNSEELNQLQFQHKQPLNNQKQGQGEKNPLQFSQSTWIQNSEKNPGQSRELHKMQSSDNQCLYQKLWTSGHQQRNRNQGCMSEIKVPFAPLLDYIRPRLDDKKAAQIQMFFNKLKVGF